MALLDGSLFGCHDILILGKSPIKWSQRPDMTLAVDWDVTHQFKQTNKQLDPSIYSRDINFNIKKNYNQNV